MHKEVNSMKEYILAIETGGTKIQMVIGTIAGDILYNYRFEVRKEFGSKGILKDILSALPLLENKARELNGKIIKIGIGFGGPVNSKEGIVIGSAQISGWKEFPIANFFEKKTGYPTYVFNDSNAAAWGEYIKGSGNGSNIFFYTNMGSGVGGGFVINGELYDGQGFGASEMGQTYIGNPLTYQNVQVEKLCSGWGIENRLRNSNVQSDSFLWELCNGKKNKLNCIMLGIAIEQKDEFALKFLDATAELFAIALCNVIHLLSPECIAIGGGVSLLGPFLIKRINYYVSKYVYVNNVGKYKIVKCVLDEDVVLVGTLLLTAKEK